MDQMHSSHLVIILSVHKSGVKYIAQPGGSVRDDNVIETCNKINMAMMHLQECVYSITNTTSYLRKIKVMRWSAKVN